MLLQKSPSLLGLLILNSRRLRNGRAYVTVFYNSRRHTSGSFGFSMYLVRTYSLTPGKSFGPLSTEKQEGISDTTTRCSTGISSDYLDFPILQKKEYERVRANKNQDWKIIVSKSARIYPNFVTEAEEKYILDEVEPYLNRLTYESSHWDDAIHDYRETERKTWNKKNTVVINRIRNLAFPPTVPQLQLVHVLDLAKKGVIKPHIDSVRFCGNTIAGLSLLSDCVMRLRHKEQNDQLVYIYLPRFSLYVLTDAARFEYTHEILGEIDSLFKGRPVPRARRISVMCRNEADVDASSPVDGPSILPTYKTGVLDN